MIKVREVSGGVGIASDMLSRVFDLFAQVASRCSSSTSVVVRVPAVAIINRKNATAARSHQRHE
jgi:hypothetical protein